MLTISQGSVMITNISIKWLHAFKLARKIFIHDPWATLPNIHMKCEFCRTIFGRRDLWKCWLSMIKAYHSGIKGERKKSSSKYKKLISHNKAAQWHSFFTSLLACCPPWKLNSKSFWTNEIKEIACLESFKTQIFDPVVTDIKLQHTQSWYI